MVRSDLQGAPRRVTVAVRHGPDNARNSTRPAAPCRVIVTPYPDCHLTVASRPSMRGWCKRWKYRQLACLLGSIHADSWVHVCFNDGGACVLACMDFVNTVCLAINLWTLQSFFKRARLRFGDCIVQVYVWRDICDTYLYDDSTYTGSMYTTQTRYHTRLFCVSILPKNIKTW